MIDSHCHLEFDDFDGDREEVVRKSKDRLEAVVDSCARINKSGEVLDLHREHPEFVFATFGLHPKGAVEASDDEIENYKSFIRDEREEIVGIGEVGLDYFHVKGSDERNRSAEVFSDMVKFSDELGLPVVVHSRNSTQDALDILKDKEEGDVIIHCFSGDGKDLEEALDRDYYLSFGGMVFRSRKKYEELLKETPLENLLLETDAPFLAKRKGERSEPWFIEEVAERISEIMDLDFEEVWGSAGRNAKEAYDLPI